MTTLGAVRCPSCHDDDTRVVDSRVADQGSAIRRRRHCVACASRFTTFERVDHAALTVVKSDGQREPFDPEKLIRGLQAATKGRDVGEPQLREIAQSVEDFVRLEGADVSSASIGLAVLERLRDIDEVAYLRFASVYKHFDAAADFHRELELMEKSHTARA